MEVDNHLPLEVVVVNNLDVVSTEVALGDGSSGRGVIGVDRCGCRLGGGRRRGLSTAQCNVKESGRSVKSLDISSDCGVCWQTIFVPHGRQSGGQL